MSIVIDRKFALLLGTRTERYARKGDDLFNLRCPFCGDSKKNKIKARGYIYRKAQALFYRCHNCGVSTTIGNLIRHLDENLHREYALETFKEGKGVFTEKVPSTPPLAVPRPFPVEGKVLDLPRISDLPANHFAKEYVSKRCIPESLWSTLYYAEDFREFIDTCIPEHDFEERLPNDERLVIPFFGPGGDLVAVQGRALNGHTSLRYITIKTRPDNPKIWGLDKHDILVTTYVLEGPIDAMFLYNSLATAGSSLRDVLPWVRKESTVLVYDNEPRNKAIVSQIRNAILDDWKVCIWPKAFPHKDINDMVKAGVSKEEIQRLIDSNTVSGIAAQMRLADWKKCSV